MPPCIAQIGRDTFSKLQHIQSKYPRLCRLSGLKALLNCFGRKFTETINAINRQYVGDIFVVNNRLELQFSFVNRSNTAIHDDLVINGAMKRRLLSILPRNSREYCIIRFGDLMIITFDPSSSLIITANG
jgi:hypothetical protein